MNSLKRVYYREFIINSINSPIHCLGNDPIGDHKPHLGCFILTGLSWVHNRRLSCPDMHTIHSTTTKMFNLEKNTSAVKKRRPICDLMNNYCHNHVKNVDCVIKLFFFFCKN